MMLMETISWDLYNLIYWDLALNPYLGPESERMLMDSAMDWSMPRPSQQKLIALLMIERKVFDNDWPIDRAPCTTNTSTCTVANKLQPEFARRACVAESLGLRALRDVHHGPSESRLDQQKVRNQRGKTIGCNEKELFTNRKGMEMKSPLVWPPPAAEGTKGTEGICAMRLPRGTPNFLRDIENHCPRPRKLLKICRWWRLVKIGCVTWPSCTCPLGAGSWR